MALLLIWSVLAKIDIVAVGHGRLVPQTYVKVVQPADSGIIREILVRQRSKVERGQVLLRLDPTVMAADSTATARELQIQQFQLRRIEAELAAKPMVQLERDDSTLFSQVQAQYLSHQQAYTEAIGQESAALERARRELSAAQELLKKLEATLPSYEKTALAYEKLASNNLVGLIQAEEKRREVIEKEQDLKAQRATVASLRATMEQSRQRLSQIRSSYANDLNQSRLEAITAITRLEQQRQKLVFQQGLLELRAPQAGIVNELATTTIGAVVQPGTVLLSLVPIDEPLMAEVYIENQDIGFVTPNQRVRIKIAAYQFQKYGMLEGVVKTVSADSSSGSDQSRTDDGLQPLTFKALVELQGQKLKSGSLSLPLAAGMQLSAEIVQGRRSVLEYLLSPMQRVTSEAGRER